MDDDSFFVSPANSRLQNFLSILDLDPDRIAQAARVGGEAEARARQGHEGAHLDMR